MPRKRRRRSHATVNRSWRRPLLVAVVVAIGIILVVGSVAEVHAQSSGFRSATDTGYGALATRVVDASNQTGVALAALLVAAPQLSNAGVPSATDPADRVANAGQARLQQGLDRAVASTSAQAAEAAQLVPPPPAGTTSQQLTQVMVGRAAAVLGIRTAVDRLLGMTPLAVAGAPTATTVPGAAPLSSTEQVQESLGSAGLQIERVDGAYRALRAGIRRNRLPIHLPASAWVKAPAAQAPLGSAQLSALAPALHASGALNPFHQLIISAVGLSPAAVPSGAPGAIGAGCAAPQSAVPGTVPTVLPPTTSVSSAVTVTNCGTVPESQVEVTEALALSDPPGTALPPTAARGATSHQSVSLQPGSSTAVAMPSLTVAGGHNYTLTLSVALPPSQQARPGGAVGGTQELLVQISN